MSTRIDISKLSLINLGRITINQFMNELDHDEKIDYMKRVVALFTSFEEFQLQNFEDYLESEDRKITNVPIVLFSNSHRAFELKIYGDGEPNNQEVDITFEHVVFNDHCGKSSTDYIYIEADQCTLNNPNGEDSLLYHICDTISKGFEESGLENASIFDDIDNALDVLEQVPDEELELTTKNKNSLEMG